MYLPKFNVENFGHRLVEVKDEDEDDDDDDDHDDLSALVHIYPRCFSSNYKIRRLPCR